MKNSNFKFIIVILNVALVVLTVILVMNIMKVNKLKTELTTVQEEVKTLEENLSEIKSEAEKAEESVTESIEESDDESQATESEIQSSATEISTVDSNIKVDNSSAVDSTAATPVPQIEYIVTIINLPAGTVLPEEKIDMVNLPQYFTSSEIIEGDEVYNRIIGKSYVENDNIPLENLRYLKLLHRNYDSQPQVGELIVNVAIAEDVIDIFTELYRQNYQVCSMHLIDDYWVGDGEKSDTASIDRDNTSAFCYRFVTGSSSTLSNHAYGCAIDLNPMENPYVKVQSDGSMTTYHENAQGYVYNRTSETPHVIDENDLAYQLFTAHGFNWGGSWGNPIDYQHFEKPLNG